MDDLLDFLPEIFVRYGSCCLLIVVMLVVFIVAVPIGGLGGAMMWHDVDPQGWEEFVSSYLLEGAGSSSYALSGLDADEVAKLGYDPSQAAACLEAQKWVKDKTGKTIDLGICMSIWKNEGIGRQDGLANACKYSPFECEAGKWLLNRWQSFNTRSLDDRVADLVNSTYTGYGGAGAGEIGPGIMPTTDKNTCLRYFKNHEVALVKACDAISDVGGSFEASAYLASCGYDAAMDDATKLQKLRCWNRQEWWDRQLLNTANKINSDLGSLNLSTMPTNGLEFDGVRGFLVSLLKMLRDQFGLDLLPSDISNIGEPGDGTGHAKLHNPLGPNYRGISTQYDKDTHPGLDFPCNLGVPVLAVADGKIVIPNRAGWRYDPAGWGYQVWIDHGNGIYTHYAHLQFQSNIHGYVKAGDTIGKCGSTGNSTGSHVHFEVVGLHPDKYKVWNDPRAPRNPYEYLGITDPFRKGKR